MFSISKYSNFLFSKNRVNPTIRGAFKAPPEQKLHFLVPFCDPYDPKKFDFSQISMTMPPIFFWGLEMAKKVVSIAFLLSAGPKFGSKNLGLK